MNGIGEINSTIDALALTPMKYLCPPDAQGTFNIPVTAGRTYYVRFKGYSSGDSASITLNMPSFSTFRGGTYTVRYADGGVTFDEFSTMGTVQCYDGASYTGDFLFSAGSTGNLSTVFIGSHSRTFIIITEVLHG